MTTAEMETAIQKAKQNTSNNNGVANLLNRRGFKVKGWTDDATIKSQLDANKSVAANVAPAQVKTVMSSAGVVEDVNPQSDKKGEREVIMYTDRIKSYRASNAVFIGTDASHLNVDPQTLEMALTAYAASFLTTGQWLKRVGNTSYQLNFDATGASTIGPLVNFQMQPAVAGGTSTLSVLGFLIRITSYQGDLGQSGLLKFAGASQLLLPTFQVQQEKAVKASYIFVPAAIGAMLNQNSQVAAAGLITDGPTLSQIANDKIACPISYAPNTTLFTVSGSNSQVLILPVFITDERAKALMDAIKNGKIVEYYDNLLKNAPSIFAD